MEESPSSKKMQADANAPPHSKKKKSLNTTAFATTGLLILSVFYTLYFARAILLPIVIAILLSFLLSPMIRALKRIKIPQHLGSLLVIFALFAIIISGFYQLSEPTEEWLENAPISIPQATKKITELTLPLTQSLQSFFNIQSQIEKSTNLSTEEKSSEVTIKQNTWLNIIFNNTWEFFIQVAIITILLYFLLASNDFFLRKLIEIMPLFSEKKETVFIMRQIEEKISYFLFVRIITSIGLAAAIALAMFFLQMPNPILWGVLAGLLEFIPYIGVLAGTIMILFSAILTFDTLGHILLVPISFFTICAIEGNIILPMLLSRRLVLHPFIILIGVLFWGWIWGIAGALIAIPLISILKIICDNVTPLTPYGKLLGTESEENLNS